MNSFLERSIPQSEDVWLATCRFDLERVHINRIPIQCAVAKGTLSNQLLIMSGGIPRETERQRNLPLINKLYGLVSMYAQERGVSSVLYNQPGTGKSGGIPEKATLKTRSAALVGLVEHFAKQLTATDITIIGSSAGAYMAISAVDELRKREITASRLILLSPAAYPEEVEAVPYGPKFSELIRKPWDVTTSPVFPKLERFMLNGGKVLLCFFQEDDPPIPRYIQEQYQNLVRRHAAPESGTSVMTIPGVAHNFRKLHRKQKGTVIDELSVRATAKIFHEFLI